MKPIRFRDGSSIYRFVKRVDGFEAEVLKLIVCEKEYDEQPSQKNHAKVLSQTKHLRELILSGFLWDSRRVNAVKN